MIGISVNPGDAPPRMPEAIAARWLFPSLALLVGLTYSSTIFLPYALSDENWIINVTGTWFRPDWRQGRPLFSLAIYATSRLNDVIGFEVMRVLRVGAVLGLALAMTLLVLWLERWAIRRAHALLIVAIAVSLPPFQVYVADATWLVLPLTWTIAGMLLFHRGLDGTRQGFERWWRLAAAFLLFFASLSYYQPTMLVGFGMLTVPLLWLDVRDGAERKRRVRFVMTAALFLLVVMLVYYVIWLALWWSFEDHTMWLYGPLALSPDPLGRLRYFFTYRLIQTFNLWYVGHPFPETRVYVYALALIAAGALADLVRAVASGGAVRGSAGWLTKYVGTVGLLVACDGIPLAAAIHIWSYVTMPALSIVATVLLVSSVKSLLSAIPRLADRMTVAVLAVAAGGGTFAAQHSVLTYVAVPHFLEYQTVRREVREYLETHPAPKRIHVIGRTTPVFNLGWMEFSWSNSQVDVYCMEMVVNVLADFGVQRSAVTVTASGNLASQLGDRGPVPADALVIDLSRIHLR